MPDVSIVVPLLDEELNVVPLHDELTRVMTGTGTKYELILIDDGSRDRTFERLVELHDRDPHVHVLRFTRNFGQTAAFAAGFAAAADSSSRSMVTCRMIPPTSRACSRWRRHTTSCAVGDVRARTPS
jgi:glycosyltransferase involved in cell wall biosynthesis